MQLDNFISKQYDFLRRQFPSDEGFLELIMNTFFDYGEECCVKNHLDISYSKILYVVDAISLFEKGYVKKLVSSSTIEAVKEIIEHRIDAHYITSDSIRMYKVFLLCEGKIEESTLEHLFASLSTYYFQRDYLYDRKPTLIICEILELLIEIGDHLLKREVQIKELISSYLEVLITYMTDVDFERNRHSFFSEEISCIINVLSWEEGDIRKSILILKEGISHKCEKYVQLGHIINQHLLLISSLSKLESDKCGFYLKVLGIISGFQKLHEITADLQFKIEEQRWKEILFGYITNLALSGRAIDIKTWVDITLSYKYLAS